MAKHSTDRAFTKAVFKQADLSENSRRAYSADLQHFLADGGKIPCDAQFLINYLDQHSGWLKIGTLNAD